MKDDPKEITKQLIAQHGSPEAALEVAFQAASDASQEDDLYGLSIWRDVKRILRITYE